jgi:hypothetical protein
MHNFLCLFLLVSWIAHSSAGIQAFSVASIPLTKDCGEFIPTSPSVYTETLTGISALVNGGFPNQIYLNKQPTVKINFSDPNSMAAIRGAKISRQFAQCYVLCEENGCKDGQIEKIQISNETVDASTFDNIKTWLT